MSASYDILIDMNEINHKQKLNKSHENGIHAADDDNDNDDELKYAMDTEFPKKIINKYNTNAAVIRSHNRNNAPNNSRTPRDLESAKIDAEPLLDIEIEIPNETELVPKDLKPPIAGSEIDEDDDDDDNDVENEEGDHEPANPNTPKMYPGVDDSFFPDQDIPPTFDPRFGVDDNDGKPHLEPPVEIHPPKQPPTPHPDINGVIPRRPSVSSVFPYAPGFGPGILTDINGTPIVIPDVNIYQHKKTLAQGMMDLALLSANANQLRYVLESYSRHPYYYFSVTFISISLILQIAVGIGLVWNSRYNVKNEEHIIIADRINNFTVLGIFLVTIVNVFISSFGVANPPDDMRN